MKILGFAVIFLTAWWFDLSPLTIFFVAISVIALIWWVSRGKNGNSRHRHEDSDIPSNTTSGDSFAAAVLASNFQHEASSNGSDCNPSRDTFSDGSDSSSCNASSYDSGSSDSGSGSSSD